MKTKSKISLAAKALRGCIRTGNFAAQTKLNVMSQVGQSYLEMADSIVSALTGVEQKSEIASACISCGVNVASSGLNTLSHGMEKGVSLTEKMLRKKYAGR